MTDGHRLHGASLAGLLHRKLTDRGVSTVHLTVGRDELLFEEGRPANAFYVIERGRIRLELSAPGRPTTVIQTLGPGDLVGLSWFTPNNFWSWSARAVVETVVEVFDTTAVREVCDADPELRGDVATALASEAIRRLHAARLQLLDLFGGAA